MMFESCKGHELNKSATAYLQQLGRWIINLLTKYWIFVSYGMLLFVSIQNTVVIYRLIYMVFYLFFILSFQISFEFWRKTLATFHLIIIIYSMIILIGLFIYQFETVSVFLSARFSAKLLVSIGLEVVPSNVFVVKFLPLSAFLVVNIMQLYYLHCGWMDLITMPSDKNIQGEANGTLKDIHAYAKQNTENPNSPYSQQILQSKPETWQESLYKFYFQTNRFYKRIIYYTWRFGELHIDKLVLFIMVLIAVLKVSAFNVALIILATLSLTFLCLRPLINLLTLIATGLYILASMCYQLEIVKQLIIEQNVFVNNCSQIFPNVTLDKGLNSISMDTAQWFGLELTSRIDQFIGPYILLTIVLTFDAIVRYRQRHRRLTLSNHFNVHLIENRFPILFEPFSLKDPLNDTYEYDIVSYQQADESVIHFLKYLFNFIFYRFGLEVCYITTVIVIGVRLDVLAVLYAIWLGLFLISSRRTIRRVWSVYIFFHMFAFPLQYMSDVGAPPFLCIEYPWKSVDIKGWEQLKHWLYLPDYQNPSIATQLIADFFQFLFACQQWRVFVYENDEKDQVYVEAGGSNREIIYDDDVYKNNPTWDFVTNKRNLIDYIKYAIFMYGAWTVLSIVYLVTTTRFSLFGLGYLIGCFCFLLYGQDFLTKRVAVVLRLWNCLIYYCFSVVFLKACLQVVACVAAFNQLNVQCNKFLQWIGADEQCHQIAADASVFIDGLFMAFLLLQKRIFGSYYWEHIVTELHSQAKLANQGVALFNEISRKRIEEAREREAQTLSKINRSLKRIAEQKPKSNQSDSKGASEPSEHSQAILSGDYYMFNYESDEEPEEVDERKIDQDIVAQDKILQVLPSSELETAVTITTEKSTTSSPMKSNGREFDSTVITVLPALIPPDQPTSIEPEEEKFNEKIKSILNKINSIGLLIIEYLIMIIEYLIDYLIDLFNRNSSDYREVVNKLAEMKSKEKITQQEDIRRKPNIEITLTIDIDETAVVDNRNTRATTQGIFRTTDKQQSPRLYRLFNSLFYFAISRSHLLCYSAMIINHLISGTFLSMLPPLSIYLYATLSSRPSKYYWIIVLIYVQMMIGIKYLLQFQHHSYSFLLLSLVLHRLILKQLGFWKSEQIILNDLTIARVKSITTFFRPVEQELFVDDVYTPMFFCDFINMAIVIGFYSQFGERTGINYVQRIKENRVPLSFLVILLIQFILIIIDRALYLRRNVYGKFFFQLFQVIVVHIWLFLVVPEITEMKFRDNVPAQLWYIFKCIYFGYSSIQIRLGYPKHLVGHFLMKHFNYVNRYVYRIYMLIPFLLELRTLMNWMFTDTSLDLSSWLQLEDIYSNVYLVKCARWAEKKYPTERGKSQSKKMKYGVGGLLLVLLIFLIWFPLVVFSITSSFYRTYPPKEVNIEIKLGGYLPIYQMTAQHKDLVAFTNADYNRVRSSIYSSKIASRAKERASAFLRDFYPNDIYCVNFFATSLNIWELSQPIHDILVNNLRTNVTVPVRFSYTIIRNPPNADDSEDIETVATGENTVNIEAEDLDTRNALIEILNGADNSQTMTKFTINQLLPRFLHVQSKARPEDIEPFKKVFPSEYYSNITMGLNQTRSIPNSTEVRLKLSENRTGFRVSPLCSLPDRNYLSMIFFNDKISPANISFLTRYGIMGLYTTFVIFIARSLRKIFQTSQKIMFNELPNVERLWHLLQDIDLVRENNLLLIEEELFAKIIFLYRSPETLIRFTKSK